MQILTLRAQVEKQDGQLRLLVEAQHIDHRVLAFPIIISNTPRKTCDSMLHGNAFVATESLFLEGTAKRAENSNAERQMAYTFSGHPGARKQLDYECILCEFSFCVG